MKDERTGENPLTGRLFVLDRDCLLFLAVVDVLVDGERLEGKGVQPDLEVAFQLPYAGCKDPLIEKAIEHLLAETHAAGRPSTDSDR